MRLFKRGRVWYAQVYENGRRVQRSTRCHDRPAAAVKIRRCSPNDLRRTCATWLRAAGVSPELIAPAMGHADTRMVERVYGRLPVEDLRRRLAEPMG